MPQYISVLSTITALLSAVTASAGGGAAPAGDQLTPAGPSAANWEQAERFRPDRVADLLGSLEVKPNWIGEGDLFWYSYRTGDGLQHWLVDPEEGTRRPLLDPMLLAEHLTRSTGRPHDGRALELEILSVTEGGTVIELGVDEARFRYDLRTQDLSRLPDTPGAESEPWQNISPDGSLCAYLRGNDLYIANPASVETSEQRITSDGGPGHGWGDWLEVVENNAVEPRRAKVIWSPDSRRFAILRADARQVGDLWLLEHLSRPRPTLRTLKYPLPGEKVPAWELWVFDRDTGRMTRVDSDRWPDQTLEDLFGDTLWWSADSTTLYFARRSRDYNKLDLCAADPATGESRVVIEERLETMAYLEAPVELPETGELLWWSLRDGWGHFSLYGKDGVVKRPLTAGSFNVQRVSAVDSSRRLVFLIANAREAGRNPYYRHLYRVRLDGDGIRLLTPEDADHHCVVSPSKRFIVDSYSRMDLPTRSVLRDADGRLVLELETADIRSLGAAGWRPPEVFSAMSADGATEQWGVMWRPADFDPEGRYPIVTRVYPGRQDEYIPTGFQPVNAETYLANLGCIVVRFGNRGGTRLRGVAYRDHARDDFRGYGLADKKAVIEQLGARHPFIDLERVGIYGGSSGGFMTVSAMLEHPDFFKVGVAMTAPNDPSLQSNEWAERYAGVERVVAEDGAARWECAEAGGNLELAANLEGRLLMIYGAEDDIVHPAQLFRMADALIKAGKRFDMFLVPGAGHGLGDWRYLYGLVLTYFAEHLIGEPRTGVDLVSDGPR